VSCSPETSRRKYRPIRPDDVGFIIRNLDEALERRIGYDVRALAASFADGRRGLLGALRRPRSL
jgi:hypothetical protein